MRLLARVLAAAGVYGAAAGSVQGQTGLLVVAHGAGPEWNAKVRETVAQVGWTRGPVSTAFLMGPEAATAGWDSATASLVRAGAREIVVVPLMVSSYGGHYRQIRFYAGELAEWPADLRRHDHGAHAPPAVPARVTPALDGSPELGSTLLDRWRSLDPADRARPLLLVAHGPTSDEEAGLWLRDLARATAPIAREGGIPVSIGLLRDDAPAPVRAAAIATIHDQVRALLRTDGDTVTVVPVLVSTGRIDRVTIPKDLAGLPVRYVPFVLAPHPSLARWIERAAIARAEAFP